MTSTWTELRMQTAALRALAREIGWGLAIRLGISAERGPDPFAKLPPPQDAKDRDSRDQIRPALRLYAVLRLALGDEEALRVTEKVLVSATLVFLSHEVGLIDVNAYRKTHGEGRRAWIRRLVAPFPNADSAVAEATDDHFVHHISRCRFVELCAATGVPELAPAFCAGDLVFFARQGIRLDRPSTLAAGGSCCEFRFSVD